MPIQNVQINVHGLWPAFIHQIHSELIALNLVKSSAYQSSHAELEAKHQVQLLPFEPVDRVSVLSHGQGLASDSTRNKDNI